MTTLQELRKKYPDYEDMSDQQFADAFHKKHYEDMPLNEFYSKIGFSQKNPSTFESIFSDALKKAQEAPGELWEGAKEFLPQTAAASTQIINPLRLATNLAIGLNRGGRGALNVIPQISEYLQSKGIGGDFAKYLASKKMPVGVSELEQKMLDMMPETAFGFGKRGDEAIQGGASTAFNAAVPGGIPAKLLSGALWSIGQGENPFTGAAMFGIPESIARGAKNTPKLQTKVAALADKLLDKIGKGNLEELGQNIVGKEPKKLPGSNWMEKNINPMPYTTLSIPQLEENMRIAEGKKVPIGDIFQDPALSKKFYNDIAMVEDSPAQKIMMDTAHQIVNEGDTILKHLESGATPQQKVHVGNTIISEVKDLRKEIAQTKSAKYKEFDTEAKKSNAKSDLSNVKSYASEVLNEIQSNPFNESDVPPEIIKALKNVVEKAPDEINLSDANFKKSTYGDIFYDLKSTNFEKKIFGNLYENIKKDIRNALDQNENSKLRELYDDAETYYQNEYLPFEDPDIKKFTSGKGDPDMLLQHFVKKGKLTDRSRLVRKITDKLEPETKSLFAHSYLSNAVDANGKINPLKALTLWNDLGEGQRLAIFGSKVPIIDKYMKSVAMNTNSLKGMYNPDTGAKLAPMVKQLQTMGAQAASGATAGGIISHDPLVAALVGMATPYAAKKVGTAHHNFLVNRHTSEVYRNKIFNQKIKEIRAKGQNVPAHLRLLNEALEEAAAQEKSQK